MQTLPPPSSYAQQLIRANAAPVTIASAYAMQRIELRLSDDPALAARVVRLLPRALARDVLDDVLAHRELARLTPPRPLSAFHPGSAAPVTKLRAWYVEAQRRSGVPWQLLAAVNFVESDFGRMREASVAGAQGPMQFMPSTWASYGRGDVHDPHAAILGAARFLRAAGAPSDERGALYRYNPSPAYVDAVERYTGRIRRSARVLLQYYSRPLVVRTPSGYRRIGGR
jgi:soluble lytic murein transglycosylase-like protein